MSPARALRVLDALPVGSGAAVMGTGIVSIALLLDDERMLSRILLGLVEYLIVLARADLRQLFVGLGDQWIFGGALAIATLACARATAALTAASTLVDLHPELHDATLALWAAAVLWLPALLAGELIAPRIGYDERRWSTVFPLGMYAVCSIAAASISGIGGIRSFGRIWVWVALAAWAIVVAGTLRRASAATTVPE